MLFEGLEIKDKRLANRICAAPIASVSGSREGFPTEKSLNVYGKLASSAVALINVEHHAVNQTGRVRAEQFMADSDAAASAHAQIASIIKDSGKIAMAQISHGGSQISNAEVFSFEGFRALSPSGVKLGSVWKGLDREAESLSIPEIKRLVEDFASAAYRMVNIAGYDGVVIHAAHMYLIGQFMSPLTNRRSDEYGGTPYKRARFLYEITDAVRQTIPNAVVSVRLGVADHLPDEKPFGLTIDDTRAAARELAALGADMLCISGNRCGFGKDRKDSAYFAPYAAAIRDAVSGKVPVECTGGIRSVADAEKLLKDRDCDLIGIGRPLAADSRFLDSWILQ